MKKILLFTVFFISTLAIAQNKEKIKGTKTVAIEPKEIQSFKNIQVTDNLEIFLEKGTTPALEIEADDNLHEIIVADVTAGTLYLSTNKKATNFKKLSVKIVYTDDLKLITAKDEVTVSALSELNLDNITFKTFDYVKLFLNVKSRLFTVFANDRSKLELNAKAEIAAVELSKNSNMKALISAQTLKFDMYQKATANIEGDAVELKLRLDNNANFTGKNLTAQTAEITLESYASGSIFVNTNATINASGKSELQIFGEPKIDLAKFSDNAVLMKKTMR
ncbi:DUF2807 domain-containing protein [Flavobacterium sp. NST-5]|uniref:DUF2807 domain-containing protein n=1 Tax=Flavobacterium ichthyis TaxID=2698827 RepID=A0ABW9ZCR9_9FLAO|nr:DUF2807 domain-containing protein [Flavobacterium ichthyis]NBL64558.1 DUF2807 domain-containing protein [Flavobacterium ichthyis]